MSETDLKRNVTKLLELQGWLVTRAQSGMIRRGVQLAKTGTGDLVCCAHGHYVEVETKTLTGPKRESQIKRAAEVIRRGGTYRFVRSMAEAKELVREMKKWEVT